MQIPDVPPQLLAALVEAAAGQRLALVGGVVRDLLLHRHHQDPWRGLPDLDLVVEGQAADFVDRLPLALEQRLDQAVPLRLQGYGRYGTFALQLELPERLGGRWLLDVASARQESYPECGENPQVRPGTLEQDLARRDVTVNAMALELRSSDLSEDLTLLDPHGGVADLAQRQLRFLHPASLRDDPTRLVRAARYAARLGFQLSSPALQQAREVMDQWPWGWCYGNPPDQAPASLGTRLRMEMELMLQREAWRKGLAALQAWGGLALLDPALQADGGWRCRLVWAERLGLPLLLALVLGADNPEALARRLQLPARQQTLLAQAMSLCQQLVTIERGEEPWPERPSAWTHLLEQSGRPPQAVALALAAGARPRRPLLHWWAVWRHVPPPHDAASLLAQGWLPGKGLGEELRRQRAQVLDRTVHP